MTSPAEVCRWPPGTRMSYCSAAPAVLAAVIEKASGERFEDYVQEHIFKPLHMDTRRLFPHPGRGTAPDPSLSSRWRHALPLLAFCAPAHRRLERIGHGHGQLPPVLSSTRQPGRHTGASDRIHRTHGNHRNHAVSRLGQDVQLWPLQLSNCPKARLCFAGTAGRSWAASLEWPTCPTRDAAMPSCSIPEDSTPCIGLENSSTGT